MEDRRKRFWSGERPHRHVVVAPLSCPHLCGINSFSFHFSNNMSNILFFLFLLLCTNSISAQQIECTKVYSIQVHAAKEAIEGAPHWFTQDQLREMNRKHGLTLRGLFSRTTTRRSKNAVTQAKEDYAISMHSR